MASAGLAVPAPRRQPGQTPSPVLAGHTGSGRRRRSGSRGEAPPARGAQPRGGLVVKSHAKDYALREFTILQIAEFILRYSDCSHAGGGLRLDEADAHG
jgi:hypothetical protein